MEEVDDELARLEEEAKHAGAEKNLLKMHWECARCRIEGQEFMLPMSAFGVRWEADFLARLLPQGAFAECIACGRTQRGVLKCGPAGGNTNNEVNAERRERVAASLAYACLPSCGS